MVNYFKQLTINHLPTQNVTRGFCKTLIIKYLELSFEGQILRRGTE